MLELFGILLPPLIDLINKKIIDSAARFWVSVLVCIAFGVLINYITSDGFKGYTTLLEYADAISKSIIMVFGFAQLSYGSYWRHTEAHDKLKKDY